MKLHPAPVGTLCALNTRVCPCCATAAVFGSRSGEIRPRGKIAMRVKSLKDETDASLLREAEALVEEERESKAKLAAYLEEVERRELYRMAGYDSLEAFCQGEFHLSKAELLS